MDKKTVLVTGVTGYIGGRLVPRLLDQGDDVRVMVRGTAERLNGRSWQKKVTVFVGDVLNPSSLTPALAGVHTAYYLIHSMGNHNEFSERDIQAANNFASAAAKEGVERIIYLGGLGDPKENLSEHLRSRQETGDTLRQHHVPVTEFRAGMVVGSGSISFEMLRHLTERLPMMITPRWVNTKTQPIAIRDILNYLVAAARNEESANQIIEIGSPDILSYVEMMRVYARIRGLPRLIIPVPVLTPRLSSYWVHWMTPISAQICRPLIDGLRNELIADLTLAKKIFPEIKPIEFATAVERALKRIETGDIETLWSDAISSSQGDNKPVNLTQTQGMLIERRTKIVATSPEHLFRAFSTLGGEKGWPPFNFLWVLRGILDRLVGGVGMRRGRRHPVDVRRGEAIDFWRVEAVEENHLLRLRAEMKLPGRGWLQFEAKAHNEQETELIQTAYFASKGLSGLLYWYAIYPLHGPIFSGMIEAIAADAEQISLT